MKELINADKLLLSFVVVALKAAMATVTSSQGDIEVMVGGTTLIACVTSLPKDMHWYHYPTGSNEQKYVYTYGTLRSPYLERFEMRKDSSSGLFQLAISSVELTDAGVYSCQENEGSGDAAQTQLTVLEGGPNCTSTKYPVEVIGPNSCNIEQENLTLSCSVAYRGNVLPLLEWKMFGTNDAVTQGVNVENIGNRVTSHLKISNQPVLDGSSYICQTPKTKHSCTLGGIKIIHVIGSSFTQKAMIGDTIQCNANTSQSCTYKWKWFKGDDVLTASNYRTLIPKQSGNFRCEAECLIRRERCAVTAMFAYVEGDNETSTTGDLESRKGYIVMLIVFGVVLLLCLIIGLLLLYYLKKPCLKKEKRQNEEVPMLNMDVEVTSCEDIPKLYSKIPYLDKGFSGEINGPFNFRGFKCACQRIMYSPAKFSFDAEDKVYGQGSLWKKLAHINILKFHDILLRSPALYVVMEYAEGGSVRKALNSCHEDLKNSLVKDWSTQIANGMNYLHGKEIVHRHLKAAQILIMEPFDPTHPSPKSLKIASYRLTMVSGQSDPVTFKGMFAWMAPEVIRGEPSVKASDIWSYGVTIWEMVTRALPYKGVRQVDVIKSLTEGKCTLSVPIRCPKTIHELLKGCWEQDVNKRSTFSDILSRLQKADDMLDENC